MKITHLETLCLSRLHEPEHQWFTSAVRVFKADCPIVVIHTDEGITGIGEACAYGGPEHIRDWVDFYSDMFIGRDPTQPGVELSPHYRVSAQDCAVAGIDCALWDIRGKAAGKAVAQLIVEMGLTARTEPALSQVPLYASSGCRYDWRTRPQQVIDEALDYIAQGYPAMKLRLGTYWPWDGVNVDRFLGLMRELHQAVKATGKPFGLAVDGNQRLTEEQAMPIAKELDRLEFAWFEEPIPQTNIEGYAKLAAAVDIPITGGEQFTTLEQFRYHLERKAYDIIQPDMGWCGLTEGLRIARYAEKFGIKVIPHSWHNGLMAMANAHFVAALPHPIYCELCMIQGPLQWEILKDKPVIKDGTLHFPSKPGFGVELADDVEARFPFFTGSWATPVERNEMVPA